MTKVAKVEETLEGATLEGLYRVGPVLREGGMGTVHEALQTRLNKRVAIKVMARELAGDAEALMRFRREAEIATAIGHPHIVQILDFGSTPAGAPFLVMELLEGEDLQTRLERVGRLSPTEMLHIVKQVASALAAVHAAGIVHRDLKPANIFLLDVAGEPAFVKVLDFGVSKIATAHTGLTGNTKVLGTPRYMSREQAQGLIHQIDERTDEWALACIAWEAVSGSPPFLGEDNLSLLYQVVHETPAPLVDHFPEGFAIEQVLRRALAKDKGERFAHVTDFASALEKAVMETTASATAGRSLKTPRHTLRMAAGQPRSHARVSPLGVTARRTGTVSSSRNMAPTLRARPAALVKPGVPPLPAVPALPPLRAPSRGRQRLKWLWPLAAVVVVAIIAGVPAKQPADAVPAATGPRAPVAPAALHVPPSVPPLPSEPELPIVARAELPATGAGTAAPPAPSLPSPSSASGAAAAADPAECEPADAAAPARAIKAKKAASKDATNGDRPRPRRGRAATGPATGSADATGHFFAPSGESVRARPSLENRLIREL